jgi:phosphoglycerol transferase MdoB-like AlkP superfamily enzyme
MKGLLFFCIKYFLFWLGYFVVLKAAFLLWNFSGSVHLDTFDLAGIFWYGSRMDLSVAGYFSVIPVLLLSFWNVINRKFIAVFLKYYTLLLLSVVTAGGLADIVLYPHWGTRLGLLFIHSLTDPVGVSSSVSWWQLLLAITFCIGWVAIWMGCYTKLVAPAIINTLRRVKFVFPVMMLAGSLLILPIRGGLDTSPLNHSSVYFSDNYFANQAAFNYFWSFVHDLLEYDTLEHPALYFDDEVCETLMSEKFIGIEAEQPPIYLKTNSGVKPNVILIILESISNKLIEPLGGIPGLTPGLNALYEEGIVFTRFFATGNRSDKGLSGLIGSYPALLNTSILKYPDKTRGLSFLPAVFIQNGYNGSFYYGGDVNFYNTKLLLMQSGVDRIISKSDFPNGIASMSKWGVPDEYLYDRFFNDLQQAEEPFLGMVYTISSHDPYDVPFSRIEGISAVSKYFNSVAYADSCLFDFIGKLKTSSLWSNTLVIVTSDHGALEPGPTNIQEPATYNIPMIWLGGVIDTVFTVGNISMQNDLSPTLAQQFGLETKSSPFSKNIFGGNQFAFYFTETGWGYLDPDFSFFFDRYTGGKEWFYSNEGSSSEKVVSQAKAYVQYLHNDFLKR